MNLFEPFDFCDWSSESGDLQYKARELNVAICANFEGWKWQEPARQRYPRGTPFREQGYVRGAIVCVLIADILDNPSLETTQG